MIKRHTILFWLDCPKRSVVTNLTKQQADRNRTVIAIICLKRLSLGRLGAAGGRAVIAKKHHKRINVKMTTVSKQ